MTRQVLMLSLALLTPSCAKPADQEAEAPGPVTKKAQAIYAPSPPAQLLAQTDASMKGEPCLAKVAFCVDPQGKTVEVRTEESCGEDVDAICRETVESWRFTPFVKDGVPTKTCSFTEFNLHWAPPS